MLYAVLVLHTKNLLVPKQPPSALRASLQQIRILKLCIHPQSKHRFLAPCLKEASFSNLPHPCHVSLSLSHCILAVFRLWLEKRAIEVYCPVRCWALLWGTHGNRQTKRAPAAQVLEGAFRKGPACQLP